MKGLREKLQNKKGFTLVEMLIVVAIIAILVAISIPMVSYSLDEARKATDAANLRAAKAVAVILCLDEKAPASSSYYDIEKGDFSGNGKTGYNKATQNSVDAGGAVIKVTVTGNVPTVEWVAKVTGP